MTLKVAIVGCGKIADGHVEEIQKLADRARVVAVCDLELLMAEQLATRYGIARHYDRFDALLERERPDVVHITTPPQSHVALARQALAAGCHLLVEKPVAVDADGTRQIVAAAEAARKLVTVGWSYYFDPPAETLRELIAAGALGEVVHVDSFYGYNLAGPFGAALLADPSHWVHRLPGRLYQNNIDHMLYRVTDLIEDERPAVQASGWVRRAERFGDARDHMVDELRVVLRGARASAYGTFSSHARPAGNYLRVHGTRNTVHVDYVARTVTFDAAPRLPSAIGRLVPAFGQALAFLREGGRNALRFARADFHFFAGLNRLLARFYDAIRDGGPPPIRYRDIGRVAALIDDIVRQVEAPRA
jgi:predicted dehydrogenase